jgi:hypothetical protein
MYVTDLVIVLISAVTSALLLLNAYEMTPSLRAGRELHAEVFAARTELAAAVGEMTPPISEERRREWLQLSGAAAAQQISTERRAAIDDMLDAILGQGRHPGEDQQRGSTSS